MKHISECRGCVLYKNQKPLLDKWHKSDIMWVGLSAKRSVNLLEDIPLSRFTLSGKLIKRIEAGFPELKTYKTNIVKCLPLDINGKLRYPLEIEIKSCFNNLLYEIEFIKPRIVFLLGKKVSKAVSKKLNINFSKDSEFVYIGVLHNDVYYVEIQHPSYISIYKRKYIPLYELGIKQFVDSIFI